MRHRNIIKGKEPIILCILASAGVIGTGILSAIATPKALEDLEACKDEKDFEVTKTDMVLAVAPHYIPAAALALGTITCIFGANALNKKKQATLVSAYSLLEQSYREYKNKVIEKLGEETHNEIINEVEADHVINDHYINNSDLPLFYDTYGHRYFNMSFEDVKDAEMKLNRNYAIRGYSSLNEYYAFLGLDLIDEGEVLGWDMDTMMAFYGANWIDIIYDNVKTDDGLECTVIRFFQEPVQDDELFEGVVKQVL